MEERKLLQVLTRHSQHLTRAARMLAAARRGDPLPKDAQFHTEEVQNLDATASDLIVEITGSVPTAQEWVPPGRYPYEKNYWRQDDGMNWLRRYEEGLQRSKNYLSLFLGSTAKEVHMGDRITVGAAQVVMASHAQAGDISTAGSVTNAPFNPGLLAEELHRLRRQLREESDPDDAGHDVEMGAIAQAEQAAQRGDSSGALGHLKSVGKWALDTATKIGVSIAAEAIKHATGLDN